MKVTNFGPGGLPVTVAGWSTGIVSLNSNVEIIGGGPAALNFVQRITSNTSNTLLNPIVNFASGSNIAFAVQSNTLTIIGAAGGAGAAAVISAGSNSTRVREVSTAGASTTLWSPFDHAHDGIGTITSSSSNTMQRGTWNIRPGAGIALSLTDTDGDGEFDTTTISTTSAGGGGSSSTASAFPLDDYLINSGNTRNDEFTGGTAIDGKWTLVGTTPDTVDVNSTVAGHLYMRRNDTAAQVSCYYQSLPSLPCDIFVKNAGDSVSQNFARGGGLLLLPATPTTASKGWYLGTLWNGSKVTTGVIYTAISGTFGSTVFTSGAASGANWYRITILAGGTTADIYHSPNGLFWTLAVSATALGFTAANGGVMMAPESQTDDLQTAFAMYRVS